MHLDWQFAEERQDVIFRRVRGILNKITPETFDKLSKELVNVGLDSPRTLRGLIYLLFDKALKDLKYSSLYAKLCQQISEKAPNFEQEPGPNTFCKFLISKCEDEFERRRKATEDFEGKNELTDEEFEQKVIAKQKMLGNIKFICELGKKRLLQEEILHECIRGLLSKKKERPIQDQAQDLECLCQIMRTIGSLLDIQASRNLMNQYFERIDMYSKKPELPSRIRFMLRDVIDLRNNKWRPRPFQREDNVPQPLSRLREEAGFNNSSTTTSIDNIGNTKNLMNMSDLSKMHGSKVSSLLLDDDGPSFTTTTDFHWGSNSFLPNETEFDIFSTTMPTCNKIGSSTNAPGTIRTNSTSLSTNTNSTAAVSKHPFNQMTSVSQAKHEAYVNNNNNNGMSNIHNRIDPFSDSFKTNKFGQNNRIPMPRDNIFGMHGNQDLDRHANGAHGFTRKNLAREPLLPPSQSASVLVNPKDIDLAISRPYREAPPMGQPRGNPVAHNNMPLGHRGPPPRDDNPNHISRRPIVDSPRPPPHRRGGDTSPAPRFANPQRHFDDMPPPPPPPIEQNMSQNHSRQQQNQPRNSRQGIDADHRPEQRFAHGITNGNQGMRGRRFDRSEDRFENESRQPKFSGANYRLPGRDNRHQSGPQSRDQQNFNRANQQPESELNMNWRSAGAPAPAEPTNELNLDTRAQKPVHEQTTVMSKPGNTLQSVALDKPDIGSANDMRNMSRQLRDIDLGAEESNRVENDRFHKKIQQSSARQYGDSSNINARPISPQEKVNQQVSQHHVNTPNQLSKFDNFRSTEPGSFENHNDFGSPQSRQNGARRFNNHDSRSNIQDSRSNQQDSAGFPHHRNNGQSARANQHESTDRVDRERNIQRRPQAEEDDRRPPPSRPREELERRNFRPAFGRNQSFDTQNTIDSSRVHDWRKDVPPIPVKKDHVPTTSSLVSSPLLTKPPIRMSETDFSLRPSHNLGGRAYTETLTQTATKPNEPSSEINLNNMTSDARFSIRPQVDSTSMASKHIDNKETDKVDAISDDTSKSATRDVYVAKFNSLLNQHSSDIPRIASKMKELKIPKSYHSECLISAMKQSIIGSESDRENTSKLLVSLVPSIVEPSSLLSAFRVIFEQLNALEAETPKVKSLVAEFLSRAVFDGLLALEEVGSVLIGGKHHPLFLLLLQKIEKKSGQAWLVEKFVASKINLIDMLPEADRSKERLATALKDRCLGFLDPMLTIEPDLWAQMMRDPSPGAMYRWIRENVDLTIQSTPTFAHVLIACMLKYINNITMERFKSSNNGNQQKDLESDDSTKSSPTNSSSQGLIDLEKELLSKYQQILQAFLKDKQMQLATLYALQSFYHGLDFPKGALLRWFHMLYDLSIVDDDVFFIWKEEINDEFPGKGQALFQVNTWLNWLAEPESEDEDEV